MKNYMPSDYKSDYWMNVIDSIQLGSHDGLLNADQTYDYKIHCHTFDDPFRLGSVVDRSRTDYAKFGWLVSKAMADRRHALGAPLSPKYLAMKAHGLYDLS